VVVVRKVELPGDRNPDGVRGTRDADAEWSGWVLDSVIEHHS